MAQTAAGRCIGGPRFAERSARGLALARRGLDQPRLRSDLVRDVSCASTTDRFFVGGNWKCNGTVDSVNKLVADLNAGKLPKGVEVVCAPAAVHMAIAQAKLDQSRYKLAAQNCWTGGNGAFTGEVSAEMLKDMGIPYVVLGHSERRAMCGETNEVVGTKCKHALKAGLSIIPCIGETLQQREAGQMFNVLNTQLKALADSISDWSKVVLAYEPVWAIGTGVVATPQQAEEVHSHVRKWLSSNVSSNLGKDIRIIYGGSVNDK